jgi:membrane protein
LFVVFNWGRAKEVIGLVLQKFWRDECPQRAASLAYTTLLSLVPFLVVAFAMLKGFGGLNLIQERLESLLYTHLVTTSSVQAAETIKRLTQGVHAGAVGTVGFLGFIFTAVSLLNTVAGAFNRVWGVEERRTLKDRFLTFFTLTILTPILFGASISITGSIQKSSLWTWLAIPGLGPALGLTLPFLLTWSGFLLLYTVIPSVSFRLRPAILGTLAVAVTWELVKVGFEVYVSSMASYGKIYGRLSVIPVFLLWLYVSWLIALLGFEVTYFLQHPEEWQRATAHAREPTAPIPASVRAFVIVAESFARGGGPVTATQMAGRLSVSEETAGAILAELERQGYLARVAGPVIAYLPCRPASSVAMADLWQALGGRIGAPDGDPVDQILARAADASMRTLGTTTIQDLIDAAESAPPAAAAPTRPDLRRSA